MTRNRYFDPGVVGWKRWVSYYHQISCVLSLQPESVLEIGLGSQVVSTYLRQRVRRYQSLDLDPAASPDVRASVTDIPFRDGAFDVVLCAEVLEHLPFERFEPALRELGRVCRPYVVLSLPVGGAEVALSVILPVIGRTRLGGKLSLHRPHGYDGLHYWEINWAGSSLARVRRTIREAGFVIEREIHPVDNLYNRFFVLRRAADQ